MAERRSSPTTTDADLTVLNKIQDRVLWLAVRMVDEANRRAKAGGMKVGGHQASSASSVSILTALYFHWLREGDRVCIKPHASPVYHAIQYLLGNLEPHYLRELRAFGGLQAYPSRTKDPDLVDFSSGSEGLGAVATVFAALTDRYAASHFAKPNAPRRRYVALVGDAELDEGCIWEALGDPLLQGTDLGGVLWVVDLNRQSLDRVIPGIRVRHLQQQFAANGWRVREAKYGSRLEAVFATAGGAALRRRVDGMSNEEYQSLVRLEGAALRREIVGGAPGNDQPAVEQSLAGTADADLAGLFADLSGHDLKVLIGRLDEVDDQSRTPTVLFAYTMKGWRLPFAGDPLNHSALMTEEQVAALRPQLGVDADDEWAAFPAGSAEATFCQATGQRLYPPKGTRIRNVTLKPPADFPTAPLAAASQSMSSQEAFGRALVALGRDATGFSKRIVTVSPDVSISTNLGGWINRVGVWAEQQAAKNATSRLMRWEPGPQGQHIELGISEMNLFMLLSQLGLSFEQCDELLFPVGTLYDCFVPRGVDGLTYGAYSGASFVFAGTPSGISLSHEGGAHQSAITVSLGMELPNVRLYEPCFQLETEWLLLEGLRRCLERGVGRITYLRLSTKSIDQRLVQPALRRYGQDALQQHALLGGYRLVDAQQDGGPPDSRARVVIATSGALVPEAVRAAERLWQERVAASVLNITSPDRLYAGFKASRRDPGNRSHLETLFTPEEQTAPIVTVVDGASHALAFMGGALGQRVVPLGVDSFGQSGALEDVYRYAGISEDQMVEAALMAVDRGQ